jgi:hypothetical protein
VAMNVPQKLMGAGLGGSLLCGGAGLRLRLGLRLSLVWIGGHCAGALAWITVACRGMLAWRQHLLDCLVHLDLLDGAAVLGR